MVHPFPFPLEARCGFLLSADQYQKHMTTRVCAGLAVTSQVASRQAQAVRCKLHPSCRASRLMIQGPSAGPEYVLI